MKTSNTIEIIGDPQKIGPRVFELAADIQNWAWILPHYRFLRVTEQTGNVKIADFGVTRSFTLWRYKKRRRSEDDPDAPPTYAQAGFDFPAQWQARQEIFPAERRITYHHIGGITKGMRVEWRITPQRDRMKVVIDHELTFKFPIFGKWIGDKIIGKLFVHDIAGKTLQTLKTIVETTETDAARKAKAGTAE